MGKINIQHSNCFLVYCTRTLQHIQNREESLKYKVNFIAAKKSLTQQPLKSTENISQLSLGQERDCSEQGFLITNYYKYDAHVLDFFSPLDAPFDDQLQTQVCPQSLG